MNPSMFEQVENGSPAARVVPPMGDYSGIQGNESKLPWLGKAFDFLRSMDSKTLAFLVTAVGVTAMGLTPVLISREVSAAGAIIPGLGIIVLGAVGSLAVFKLEGDNRGKNRKDDSNESPDA